MTDSELTFSDYMGIMHAFTNYSRGMDDQQLERFDKVFAPDGCWTLADGTVIEGREAIKSTLAEWNAAGFFPYRYLHMVSNPDFELDGSVVRSTSNWAFLMRRTPEGGPSMQAQVWGAWEVGCAGTYEDTLEKIDGMWLFTTRRIFNWEFAEPPYAPTS